jgi:hypothetical protein
MIIDPGHDLGLGPGRQDTPAAANSPCNPSATQINPVGTELPAETS